MLETESAAARAHAVTHTQNPTAYMHIYICF